MPGDIFSKNIECAKAIAKYYSKANGVLLSSGTTSLEVALNYLGIKKNDYVLTTNKVCYKVISSIFRVNAYPVLVEPSNGFVLNVKDIQNAINKFNIKAMILVHHLGLPVDIQSIKDVLPVKIKVIEDASQAWSLKSRGNMVGHGGDIVISSFGPSKPFSLGGGGGTSGTAALKCAVKALNIQPHQRVLISSYTFIATAAAVVNRGAIPIPIDFDFEYSLDLEQLENEINSGCGAIIPVHLPGRCFNLTPIIDLSKKYNVPVLEDACQAFGSQYKGNYAGTIGHIGTFSFHQNKQISAGEGGLVVTNNQELHSIARNYADQGAVRNEKPSWDDPDSFIGDNCRMTNIHAAILISQLQKLNSIIKQQKLNKQKIENDLHDCHLWKIVHSPDRTGETAMNILLLCNSEQTADKLIEYANKENILLRRIWNKPYFYHDVFKRLKLDPASLKKSECKKAVEVAQKLLCLPVPSILKEENIPLITSFFKNNRNWD